MPDKLESEIKALASDIQLSFSPPKVYQGCSVKSIADIDEYASNNGWIEALVHEHNQQRVRYRGIPANVGTADLIDVVHYPNANRFLSIGEGGTSNSPTIVTDNYQPFIVKNTSGTVAAVNDVGYIDSTGEYKTTTTANDNQAWAVVVQGGANNSDIFVTNRGRISVAYTGSAPSAGDFLVTSTTAGDAQASSSMRPEIFGVCLASGSGGLVQTLLLCHTTFMVVAPSEVLWQGQAGTLLSDSDWAGTIQALPGGGTIRYVTTGGSEDNLLPKNTSVLAKMRLYNSTQAEYGLINDADLTGGAGYDGEIILTDTVPGSWGTTDVITIESQTNTSNPTAGVYFSDFEITSSEIHPLTRSILAIWATNDSGAANEFSMVHPFEANNSNKRDQARTQVAAISFIREAAIPIISNRFCMAWTASGTGTMTWNLRAKGLFIAAP